MNKLPRKSFHYLERRISLAQQFSSYIPSPARDTEIVEVPASEAVCFSKDVVINPSNGKSGAGSLQSLKDRFVQWGSCDCPEEFLEDVHPCKGVTIVSCPICQKENRRIYS